MKTLSVSALLRYLPDNIFQMQLQSRFFAIAFPILGLTGKLNILLLAFLPAGVDTLNAGLMLLKFNRILPVLVASILLIFPVGAYIRVVAAFLCTSSIFNLTSFTCVPPEQVH